MKTLEVEFARLAECVVSPGWRLSLPATNMSAIHYNLRGSGLMIVGDDPPISLAPHTLVICPPRRRLDLQGKSQQSDGRPVGRIREMGSGAMTAALLKQVLITILRRCLVAADRWAERFAMLACGPARACAHSSRIRLCLSSSKARSGVGVNNCWPPLLSQLMTRFIWSARAAGIGGYAHDEFPDLHVARPTRLRTTRSIPRYSTATPDVTVHSVASRRPDSRRQTCEKLWSDATDRSSRNRERLRRGAPENSA